MEYERIEDGDERDEVQVTRSHRVKLGLLAVLAISAVALGASKTDVAKSLSFSAVKSTQTGKTSTQARTSDEPSIPTQKKNGVKSTQIGKTSTQARTSNEPSVPTQKLAKSDTSSTEWMDRDDVQEMAKLKVKFGDMDADAVHALFKKYQDDFNRAYDDDVEEAKRFDIFKINLKSIDALNRQNPLALFGITDSADKTQDERQRNKMSKKWSNYESMKAGLPQDMMKAAEQGPEAVMGKAFKRDTNLYGGMAMQEGEVEWASAAMCAACKRYPELGQYNLTNAPENFDWRALGAVSNVKNQKYCGSCWTFSTAQDIEGTHFLATGNLTSFAEEQLVSCDSANDGCQGGWMYSAMQYIENFGGIVSAESYPYKGIYMDYMKPTPTCETELLNSKLEKDGDNLGVVTGYQMVAMGESYEELMKVFLAKNGPLSLAMNANGMEYYIHGIIGCETIADEEYCEAGSVSDSFPCDPTELDHGVLAVAYGVENGVPYWVIKNSWGEVWGEDGYYRVERGTNHCGVASLVLHSVHKMV